MKEIFINPAKTCAFSGHRILNKFFNKEVIKKTIRSLIKDGYDTFLNGMAVGFDAECFNVLLEIRKTENIKIIACIPCPEQPCKFSEEQKKQYSKMLEIADDKIIISEKYTSNCMKKRNKFMVDNCSVLVTYLKRDFGGTKFTVDYAEKKGIKIIYI